MDDKSKVTKKKKVVVTSKPKEVKTTTTKRKVKPTTAKKGKSTTQAQTPQQELVFGRENYIYMGVGIGLIVIGMFLMGGGKMPSPEIWDDSIIYGFRRTVLAPIVILAGLVMEIFAIFKGYTLQK